MSSLQLRVLLRYNKSTKIPMALTYTFTHNENGEKEMYRNAIDMCVLNRNRVEHKIYSLFCHDNFR